MRRPDIPASQTLWAGGRAPTANHAGDATCGLRSVIPGLRGSALRAGEPWLDGILRQAGGGDQTAGVLSGGGQRASGSGRADGNPFGPVGGAADARGPRFDLSVPKGGYGWWYADGISDDGEFGFSIIALIGSVFSPYYAWAERENPMDHIALNVGIYGKGVKRWTMTERGARALSQSQDRLTIGPSNLEWDGTCLTIHIDEWAVPLLRKVRGTLKLYPSGITKEAYQLDEKGRHFWRPIAPSCRVECAMDSPVVKWNGHGYIDSNWGSEALEDGFTHWDWSRADLKDGAGLLYDAFLPDGTNRQLALRFDDQGNVERLDAPQRRQLKSCPIWRMPRTTLTTSNVPEVRKTFEDTPFYSRSQILSQFDGEPSIAMHESLDLRKFSKSWVRFLLPFRMPRRV